MLSRMSITRQFALLGLLGMALTLIAEGISLETTYEVALQARESQLQALVDSGVTMTEGYVSLARSGKMTTAQAQAQALAILGAARFDHGNYYFVYRYDGTVLQHARKNWIGTNRLNVRDPYGTLINGPMLAAAIAGQPIMHAYYIPKANSDVPEPKISTMEAVPQWGWAIGTGVYVDDLRAALIARLMFLAEIFLPLFAGFTALVLLMRNVVSGMLSGIVTSMERISAGALDAKIPGLRRPDEIGRMARQIAAFRDAALEKSEITARARKADELAEAERAAREAEREAAARAQAEIVAALGSGLKKLAQGDLLFRLEMKFPPEYEALRTDLNNAVATLQDTMQTVTASAQALRSGVRDITQASDDLSRRTEQQAATLEQTAAALDTITATVRKTAERAGSAREVVATAQTDAQHSGGILRNTVGAMSSIETSSREIASIIGVIDEIAFQTNLLALNAGVEAARAGDAGRGFAVVATEVRALAQRSADAAKQIKTLIATSGAQVENGVKLVAQTGAALTRIAGHVTEVSQLISDIAASASEQASGLHEVNMAMNQMDQVTQQNAAMVEKTTSSAHGLARETGQLARLIARFQTMPTHQAQGRALPALV